MGQGSGTGAERSGGMANGAGKEGMDGGREMMGKRDDGEGGEPAGWRGGEDGGGRRTRGERGDGESPRASRVSAAALPVPCRQWTARPPGVSPCTHLGAPAPDPLPRSGSSFPPCPCDLSAPESRSLRQVPLAASPPRGTPGATPPTAYHWLEFTPVTFPLAEELPGMQIRTGPPPR